jgi:hypothetical protein
MLFDWLVTGHVIDTNPAHSVRGPRYTVKKGKTPVLTAEEAHALLESIPITKKPANDTEAADQPDLLGLRDRALIAIMVYSFARIGADIFATVEGSDFSCLFFIGFDSSSSRCGPLENSSSGQAGDLPVLVQRAFLHARV